MLALSDTAGIDPRSSSACVFVDRRRRRALVLRSRVTREPAPDIPRGDGARARPTPRSRRRCCRSCRAGASCSSRSSSSGSRYNWLIEPSTNLEQEQALKTAGDRSRPPRRRAVQRGEPARRRVRPVPRPRAARRRDPRGRPATPTRRTSPRSAAGRRTGHPLIKSLDDI